MKIRVRLDTYGLLKMERLPNEASVVLTRTTDSIKDIYQMSNPITMNQLENYHQ